MAKRLPTFLLVISPKMMAPRVSKLEADTTERPVCWSKPGWALVSDSPPSSMFSLSSSLPPSSLGSDEVAGRDALRLGLRRRHGRVDEVEGQARGRARSGP